MHVRCLLPRPSLAATAGPSRRGHTQVVPRPWIRSPSSPRAYPRRPSRHQFLLALGSLALGICILTVSRHVSPHVPTLSHHAVHDRTLGPKLMHSHRARTRPCAWPRASASPPELPRSASNWHLPHTIRHAGQCGTILSSTARRRSTLDCTASLRGSSRARLSMHLSAPLHSAHGTAQYALRGSLCSA